MESLEPSHAALGPWMLLAWTRLDLGLWPAPRARGRELDALILHSRSLVLCQPLACSSHPRMAPASPCSDAAHVPREGNMQTMNPWAEPIPSLAAR